MCKIMSVSNTKNIPLDKLDEHLLFLRDQVTAANKDGFGYAMSFEDEVFTEKFVNPDDFKGMLKSIHPKMNNRLFDWSGSMSEGKFYPETAPLAIIAHGRTSTNIKGYADYSHPFFDEQTKQAFVHNGVVSIPVDHSYYTTTPNDSEYLAHVFWDKGLKGVAEVSGYYAFLNLKTGGKLEVVKDNRANLYGAFCPTLDGYIFATADYMIRAYAGKFSLEISNILALQDCSYASVASNRIEKVKTFRKVADDITLTSEQEKAFKDYSKPSSGYVGSTYRAGSYGSDYSGKRLTSPASTVGKGDAKSGVKSGKKASQKNAGETTPIVDTTTTASTKKACTTGRELLTLVQNRKGETIAVPSAKGESELLDNYRVSRITGKMLTKGMSAEGLSSPEVYELAVLEYGTEKAAELFPHCKTAFQNALIAFEFDNMNKAESVEEEIDAFARACEVQDAMRNDPFYFSDDVPPLDTEDFYHQRFNRKGDT
jgi:predicted glutamine amidotransferase